MKRGWRNILFSLTSVLILSFNGITVFGDVRVVAEGENFKAEGFRSPGEDFELNMTFQRFQYNDMLAEYVERAVNAIIAARAESEQNGTEMVYAVPIEECRQWELERAEQDKQKLAEGTPAGYEWHFIYALTENEQGTDWNFDIKAASGDTSGDLSYGTDTLFHGFSKKFGVNYNGTYYPECLISYVKGRYVSYGDDMSSYFAVCLPQGYSDPLSIMVYPKKLDEDAYHENERRYDEAMKRDGMVYNFMGVSNVSYLPMFVPNYDNGFEFYVTGSPEAGQN